MSLFKDYYEEREGLSMYEEEHGFLTYKIVPEAHSIYIVDLFVAKEHRKGNKASEMANKVAEMAKNEYKCTSMLGSVCTDANGAADSIKVLTAYGMSFTHQQGNMLFFKKEIK